jgi:hypothetical protein
METDMMNEKKTGIVYELRCMIDDEWHPFYVGQTNNPKRRIGEHRNDAKNAKETSTLVYRNIKEYLLANDIKWDMFEIEKFDETSPDDLEDEHIVRLLMTGAKLWNSKKGSPNWLEDRQKAADDMRARNIFSYRKYREVLSLEEHNRKIEEQNAKRVLEEALKQAEAEYRLRELTAREAQREKIKQNMLAAAERARIEHERLEAESKRKQAEREAKWLADAPIREARLRAETERLQREEEEYKIKQAKAQAVRQEAINLRKQATDKRLAEHEIFLERVKEQEFLDLVKSRERIAKIMRK